MNTAPQIETARPVDPAEYGRWVAVADRLPPLGELVVAVESCGLTTVASLNRKGYSSQFGDKEDDLVWTVSENCRHGLADEINPDYWLWLPPEPEPKNTP